jgi:Coenzyme PQQ synthesis protein D (PqqD)
MSDSAGAGDGEVLPSTVWRRASATAYVDSPDRVVVVDLDHLDLPPYVFEGSAAQIWAAVDGERSEAEIVADLAEAFQAPVDVVTADVRQFVDRLRELGLVVGGGD